MKFISNKAKQPSIRSFAAKYHLNKIALATMLVPAFLVNSAQAAPAPHSAAYAKGQILVQPVAGLSDEDFAKIINKHGAKSKRKLAKMRTHIISVPAKAEKALVKALSKNPRIEFAELDIALAPTAISANDTYFSSGWHLNKIELPTAWQSAKGDGVVIAILDTGVNSSHNDLKANILPGWNAVSKNSDSSDIYGHGTKVAGAAAAASDNGIGVTSVAWNSSILPVRISNNSSSGTAYTSDAASGLVWAADQGADIANISYAFTSSATVSSAASYMRNKGGLVVVASGNHSLALDCSDNPDIITVGATDSNDNKTSWSNSGNCLDVVAPGTSIMTTNNSGGYSAHSGTSYASPVVAGALALLKSVNPNLSNDELENILESTANKSKNAANFDPNYGYGRIDVAAAVAMAEGGDEGTPVVDQEAPVVAITSPTENSTHSGLFNITANASDNIGVSYVNLYVNGSFFAKDSVAPYQFSFDSNQVSDGDVKLTAVAFDAAQNNTSSADHWVTVKNAVAQTDNTAPQIVSATPSHGSNLSGNVSISMHATDNVAATKVAIYINGALKAQAAASSVSYSWNTRKVTTGQYNITFKAYDAAGNSTSKTNTINFTASSKGRGKRK